MERHIKPEVARPPQGEDPRHAAASDREIAADRLAEERSEDDGMPEHADKASDPVRWAAGAARRSEYGPHSVSVD